MVDILIYAGIFFTMLGVMPALIGAAAPITWGALIFGCVLIAAGIALDAAQSIREDRDGREAMQDDDFDIIWDEWEEIAQ